MSSSSIAPYVTPDIISSRIQYLLHFEDSPLCEKFYIKPILYKRIGTNSSYSGIYINPSDNSPFMVRLIGELVYTVTSYADMKAEHASPVTFL